jgi:hypothetical protein
LPRSVRLIISKSFINSSGQSFFTTNFTSIVSWRIDRPVQLQTCNIYTFFTTLSRQNFKLSNMKHSVIALALISAVVARPASMPLKKREVPQEHSHRNILNQVNTALFLDNPDDIQDSVFGLLGAAAAAEGAGNIADADCLQQATADQAFTNAKAAGDVDGMTAALIYRALERNTGSVGLASVPCASIKAVNPEIAALQQHQDPAGDGAQDLNKQIATELAAQISAIGGDAALANEASTFAPGKIGDPTGAGNTCDDANDDAGCINSLNLRVDDLSAAEITAAAGGAAAGGKAAGGKAAGGKAADGKAAGGKAADGKAAAGGKAKGDKNAAAGNAAAGNAAAGNATGNAVDAQATLDQIAALIAGSASA